MSEAIPVDPRIAGIGRAPIAFEVPVLFFHGSRAQLAQGDLIEPGRQSNFGSGRDAQHVYMTATLDGAIWGAELAKGDGPGRVYIVEPTGPIEDDPNVTDKKFPGNPTRSFRSQSALRVVGEIWDWHGHAPDALHAMQNMVDKLAAEGVEADD